MEQHYDIQSNDPAQNKYVATVYLSEEVMDTLLMNPNDISITQVNPGTYSLNVNQEQYTFKDYSEDNLDFYRLDRDTGVLAQVGIVQKKLMMNNSKINDKLKETVKKKTVDFNRKDSTTRMLGDTSVSKVKRTTTKKPKITTKTPSVSNHVPDKPHFSTNVKDIVSAKNSSITATATPEAATKKRKKSESSSASKKKKKETEEDTLEADLINTITSSSADNTSKNNDEDDDATDFLDNLEVTVSSNQPAPSTNGSKKATPLESPTPTIPLLVVKTMTEEDPSLNPSRRNINFDKKEPELKNREIRDIHEYNTIKEEYRNKYETYVLLDKKLTDNNELFNKLTNEYNEAVTGVDKLRAADNIRKLFIARQEEIRTFNHLFKILHEELAQIKKLAANFVNSKKQQL
ncbi:zonadhesin [Acrasis kona]|uniref:Zonadhesin n=1 Tax=Acrasis kona TaxID=1008807 RepID=A0AAW2YJF2_9EUKA